MKKILGGLVIILALSACQKSQFPQNKILVGTYTQKGSNGIYLYGLNKLISSTEKVQNPSFVLPLGNIVYAVNEEENGKVQAYHLDADSGKFTFLNEQETGGAHPCHLSSAGGLLFAANYTGGSLAVFPINQDGSIGFRTQLLKNTGSGPVTDRQEKSHIHSSFVSPDGKQLWAADLGTDEVIVYSIGRSGINEIRRIKCTPGSGPRHIAFHQSLPVAYVINELNNKMQVISTTSYQVIQEISTLPADFKGTSYCADVHVSPDGRFLYGSNRLADNLVIYKIDKKTGRLAVVGFEPVGGKFPRSFAISPDGKFILAANQNSDNITTFRRDKKTGLLSLMNSEIKVSTPVCVKFLN